MRKRKYRLEIKSNKSEATTSTLDTAKFMRLKINALKRQKRTLLKLEYGISGIVNAKCKCSSSGKISSDDDSLYSNMSPESRKKRSSP